MKPTVVMVGLALLAGLGAGYLIGIRQPATVAAPTPAIPAPESPTTADPKSSPASTTLAEPTTVAPPSLEEVKQRLAAWIAAGSPRGERSKVGEYLTVWSTSEPDDALEFIFDAPDFPWRNGALSIPLASIARRDPVKVCTWLRSHLPDTDCGEIAAQVIGEIHRDAPRQALALAEADGFVVPPRYRGMILASLARTSPAEALAAFSRLPEGGRSDTAAMLATAWAATDPAAALRWTDSIAALPGAENARRGVILQLARGNPAQAFALLSQQALSPENAHRLALDLARQNPTLTLQKLSLVPAEFRVQAFSTAAADSFAAAPDRIAALAKNALPAPKASEAIAEVWNRWLAQDRRSAEAWAASVQDPVLRNGLEMASLGDTANTDPVLFLASVAALPSAHTEKPLIQSALDRLDPSQALDWIAAHPTLVEPDYAAQAATTYFAADRDQATAWAHRLPPGEARNRSLAGLALSWVNAGDTAKASSAIAAIADQRLQTGTRFQIFTTLYLQDSAAASQWLNTQPVSPEIRANWEALAGETSPAGTRFAPGH
jgi:hypothetical protein